MLVNQLRNQIILNECKHGLGVFAREEIKKDEVIFEFKGSLYTVESLDFLHENYFDYYLQICSNIFMGPSNLIDDFSCHSCDPNSFVKILEKRVFLIAIRNIKQGDEITFDYSITMKNDNWTIDCNCGSKICRKIIKEFAFLPKEIQKKYITMGIVPSYVLQSLNKR